MNILVTGATGFVGSVLLPRLLARPDVEELAALVPPKESADRLPADERLGIVRGDIRDRAAVSDACRGRSHVVHLAGLISYARRDRELLLAVNRDGTANVVEGCLAAGARRLVHVSSVGAVGFRPDGKPADESTPFNWPADFHYMASKREGQRVVEAACRERGLRAVILNPASIMGPGDPNPDTPHNRLYGMALRGALLASFSGGLSVVDVRDVAALIERSLEEGRAEGESYLVVGANVAYAGVIRSLGRAAGRRAAPVKFPAPLLAAAGAILEAFAGRSGRTPLLTRAYGRLSGRHAYHINEKSRREFGHAYIDFETTVRDGLAFYRRNFFAS